MFCNNSPTNTRQTSLDRALNLAVPKDLLWKRIRGISHTPVIEYRTQLADGKSLAVGATTTSPGGATPSQHFYLVDPDGNRFTGKEAKLLYLVIEARQAPKTPIQKALDLAAQPQLKWRSTRCLSRDDRIVRSEFRAMLPDGKRLFLGATTSPAGTATPAEQFYLTDQNGNRFNGQEAKTLYLTIAARNTPFTLKTSEPQPFVVRARTFAEARQQAFAPCDEFIRHFLLRSDFIQEGQYRFDVSGLQRLIRSSTQEPQTVAFKNNPELLTKYQTDFAACIARRLKIFGAPTVPSIDVRGSLDHCRTALINKAEVWSRDRLSVKCPPTYSGLHLYGASGEADSRLKLPTDFTPDHGDSRWKYEDLLIAPAAGLVCNMWCQDRCYVHWKNNELLKSLPPGRAFPAKHRIYLNPDPARQVEVFDALISRLEKSGARVQMKILNHSEEFIQNRPDSDTLIPARTDGILIWADAQGCDEVLREVLDYAGQNQDIFSGRISPHVTCPIAAGIALGDEPGIIEESLTSHREGLIRMAGLLTKRELRIAANYGAAAATPVPNTLVESATVLFKKHLIAISRECGVSPLNFAFNSGSGQPVKHPNFDPYFLLNSFE